MNLLNILVILFNNVSLNIYDYNDLMLLNNILFQIYLLLLIFQIFLSKHSYIFNFENEEFLKYSSKVLYTSSLFNFNIPILFEFFFK